MPRTKHQAKGAELALLRAVEGAAQGVAEAEAQRDNLIRRARQAGAILDDLVSASGLSRGRVRKIVEADSGAP